MGRSYKVAGSPVASLGSLLQVWGSRMFIYHGATIAQNHSRPLPCNLPLS